MELQPSLRGELLSVRPLCEADFEELYAVASDPLIWEQHPVHDRWKRDVFRGFMHEALQGGGAFAVVDNATGAIIGSSRYHGHDAERSEVEIGWTFLARSHWGGRYNGELKQLMLDHAFRFVNRVRFLIGPDNVRSQRAVEKIGAMRTGETLNERGHTSWVFALERPGTITPLR